jgi:hypothetical protein
MRSSISSKSPMNAAGTSRVWEDLRKEVCVWMFVCCVRGGGGGARVSPTP